MEHLLPNDIDPPSTPESQQDPISPKEQKAYEKKLKQYEKDKARWEYFQENKSRLMKNNTAIEKHNTESIHSNTVRTNGVTKPIRDYGFIPMDKIIATIDTAIIEMKGLDASKEAWMYYVKEVNESSLEEFQNFVIGCKLTHLDKKYNFIPKLTGAYGCIYEPIPEGPVSESKVFNVFSIFSVPPLPKKPIPPEAPKANVAVEKKLTDLKKEVLTSKEMELSRKIYGDTVPTKLEVISNGKTIKVDQQTYDLYNQFKATRKERPHDLNYSFEHFQTTYLDKHPQFMRKEQKEK